jgi:hypothetical protein
MKRIPSEVYRTQLTMPDQRVSNKTKSKAEWYIPVANYIIDEALGCNNKETVIKFLQAANAIVDTKTYDYVMKNYIHVIGEDAKLYGEIRDVDFLTPIKERYMGEFINLFNNYQIVNADTDIILKRNKDVGEKVMSWINQEVINELNKRGVETNQQSVTQEDVEEMIKKFEDHWKDAVVEDSVNRIEFFNLITNAKEKYIKAYYYWWSCEEVYSYRDIKDDDVHFEIVSPLEYYRIPSGEKYVEDDDMGMRHFQCTIAQIKERFRDVLTDKEIKYLEETYINGDGSAVRNDNIVQRIRGSLEDWSARDNMFNYNRIRDFKPYMDIDKNFINCYHYVWKTEVKVGYLIYTDVDGKIKSTIVDETYKLNEQLGDVAIEWDWILETWQGYRFGGTLEGVYTKPEPIPVQREHFTNMSKTKLPYNGITGLVDEDYRNPVPYRIIPYLALYRIYTLQQERAVAKFKSWLLMPESIYSDSTQMTSEERIAAANKDGIYLFDDADANNNVLSNIREITTSALNNYIQTIEHLKDNIKNEVYTLANMNSSRMGENKDYIGKSVMQQSYANALSGSIWLLECFNNFRERDYLANLDYTKYAWIDGKSGSYINSSTGEVVVFDLNGSSDISSNIGIFMQNNYQISEQLNEMKSFAFSAAQNGEFNIALEAITTNSVSKLKANILKAVEANREFQLQLKQQEQLAQQQLEQMKAENEAKLQQMELQKIQLENEAKIAQINTEYDRKLEIEQLRWQVDTNRNGYVTEAEAAANQTNNYTEADIQDAKMKKILGY